MDRLQRELRKFGEQQKRLATRAKNAQKEKSKHQVQNMQSIKFYWRQVMANMSMRIFERENDEAYWRKYDQIYDAFHMKMSESDVSYAPTRQQFAVALAAEQGNVNQRLVFSQPPGTGKTRTIFSFIYLRCLERPDAKIVVRFPSKILMK